MRQQLRATGRAAIAVSLALAAFVLGAGASSAGAQALPPFDYSQYDVLLNTLGISNLPTGRARDAPKPGRTRPPQPAPPTARQRATLRFRPSAAITERLYRQVATESGQAPEIVREQLDAAKAEYRRVLVDVAGWRVADLADCAAFGLVQAYVKLHDVSDPPARGLERLRRAVADDLAARAPLRRLSDARQQEIAERLELRVIFLISDLVGAQAEHDPAAETSARAAMRAWARAVYGVDVTAVRLTARGLVRR